MAPAHHQFDRLPISVAAAVLETLDTIAENPRRLGKRLALEHDRPVVGAFAVPTVIFSSSRSSGSSAWWPSGIADVYRPR